MVIRWDQSISHCEAIHFSWLLGQSGPRGRTKGHNAMRCTDTMYPCEDEALQNYPKLCVGHFENDTPFRVYMHLYTSDPPGSVQITTDFKNTIDFAGISSCHETCYICGVLFLASSLY